MINSSNLPKFLPGEYIAFTNALWLWIYVMDVVLLSLFLIIELCMCISSALWFRWIMINYDTIMALHKHEPCDRLF